MDEYIIIGGIVIMIIVMILLLITVYIIWNPDTKIDFGYDIDVYDTDKEKDPQKIDLEKLEQCLECSKKQHPLLDDLKKLFRSITFFWRKLCQYIRSILSLG